MNERTRNGKPLSQDALGFVFCLVGGFCAVSIVLFIRGQEPRPGLVSAMTWPVLELIALLGAGGALFFSLGLAALGAVLFLRTHEFGALRPLLAILFGSLGVASILGALGFGGAGLAANWLPGLVPGLAGRVLAFVLGVPLAWLGWTLVAERTPRRTTTELAPRVGLAVRHDVSAGVSPAEAALLVSEPRTPAVRPAPRRDAAVPVREETIRPFTPREVPASESRTSRLETPSRPARATVETPPAVPAPPAVPLAVAAELVAGASDPVSVLTPPAPSWEGLAEESAGIAELAEEAEEELEELEEEEEEEREEAAAEQLGETLSAEFETEAEEELEENEDDEAEQGTGEEEVAEAAPASTAASRASAPPPASWEQAGLFDDQELEEEAEAAKPAKVELTPPFDFEAAEPKKPAHEPEQEDRSILVPVRAPAATRPRDEAGDDDAGAQPASPARALPSAANAAAAAPAPAPPAPAPEPVVAAPEPVIAREEESERWSRLVFDAGCTILEQQRVTVSLLERRFGIDFDQACRVLDELQQTGLIGPYMGGRTRDILLTREQ